MEQEIEPSSNTSNEGMVGEDPITKYMPNNADWNRREEVIKDITHLQFTHLIFINLLGNSIVSIEGLPLISMPQLQTLHLGSILHK
jgi:hypothetical protein